MNYSGPCFPIFPYLPEFVQTHDIELGMPSNHPVFCCLLLLLLSIFSSIRVFPSESPLLIRWPKYQSFSFSVSPSNEYSGLISFKIDWLDHVEVQGIHTLQSKALTKSGITLILVFECWALIQLFHSPRLPSSKGSLVPLLFQPLECHHLLILGCWYFFQQSWFHLVTHPVQHFA